MAFQTNPDRNLLSPLAPTANVHWNPKTKISFLLNPEENESAVLGSKDSDTSYTSEEDCRLFDSDEEASIDFALQEDLPLMNSEKDSAPAKTQQDLPCASFSHEDKFPPLTSSSGYTSPGAPSSQSARARPFKFLPKRRYNKLNPEDYRANRAGVITTIQYRSISHNLDGLSDFISLANVASDIHPCACNSDCMANPPNFSELYGHRLITSLWDRRICPNRWHPIQPSKAQPEQCGALVQGNVFWDCHQNTLYQRCPNPQCMGKWQVPQMYAHLMTEKDVQKVFNLVAETAARRITLEQNGSEVCAMKEKKLLKQGICNQRRIFRNKWRWESKISKNRRKNLEREKREMAILDFAKKGLVELEDN